MSQTPSPDRTGEVELPVDLGVYSLTAVKKALYKFSDRCGATIESPSGKRVVVRFAFGTREESKQREILTEFAGELLDQDLREIVAKETTHLRNIILAHAFSKTGMDGDETKTV